MGPRMTKNPEDIKVPLLCTSLHRLFSWNSYSLPQSLSVWAQQDSPQTEKKSPASDHDYCVTSNIGMEVELQLQDEAKKLQEETKLPLESSFFLERFAGSDDDIRFLTRFASYRHLLNFWRLIEPAVRAKMIRVTNTEVSEGDPLRSTKLKPSDELMMFLIYLSVGLLPQDLAAMFRVDCAAVSRIIPTWSNFLYQLLGKDCLWLPREVVRALLPPVFADYSDTQVVLSCTEISCQAPSDLLELFSTHKSHTKLKALIGMAPHGAITFVSSLYAGSMRYPEIFKRSGITSVLEPDMAVMVDKGFLIDKLAPCRVYRPFNQSLSIARHVERCIQRTVATRCQHGSGSPPAAAEAAQHQHQRSSAPQLLSAPLTRVKAGDMDNTGKEKEAMQLMAEADKKVKASGSFLGGMFGGNHKVEDACEMYARAANMFKMAKNWSAAGNAFCQAARLHMQLQNKLDSATSFVTQGTPTRKPILRRLSTV
ncbi:hypothetical protein WMY93_018566 [Mugilogobius chulae]|uniref:DDE Tnp4 domain-containing protein n=1 Tax=Mugilogobius chulae TaxID=88201 RepID=A0AAW0NP37_9GOBI